MKSRIACCFLMLVFGWLGLLCSAWAAPQELTQARATITVNGLTTASTVTLPYHWDRLHPGQRGTATFDLPYLHDGSVSEPHAVYFLRLGNAYEVWLNGTLLQRNGDLDDFDTDDYAKAPRYVAIPSGLLQTTNQFRIRIRADGGRRGGLAQLVVGLASEVEPLYRRESLHLVTGTRVVLAISLLVAAISLVLWLTQSDSTQPRGLRRDSVYLYAGLAELGFSLRAADALIEQPPLPWHWWGALGMAALACWMCCMVMFLVHVAEWPRWQRSVWLKRVLGLLFLAGGASSFLALWLHRPILLTLWMGLMAALFIPFGSLYLLSATRNANRMHILVALALAVNVVAGLRDWLVFRMSGSYGDSTLLRYSAALFGLSFGYIVVTRFHTATAQARDLLSTFAARVSQKESELQQSYLLVERLAREQERAAERASVLRDMHDGVGSHITSAIRQLQSGKASNADVLQTLRDSLDQLKLSIDAINLPPGDITALLANLRYRLEPRFAASNIELQWNVDLLAPLLRLDSSAMRQLRFMLYEALSNVLQHAQASVLRIEASASGAGAMLRIVDNGRGFDSRGPLRNGLLAMRDRATSIGAVLVLASEPGRTVVEILLD